jgi:hypothetical protein
VLGGIRRAGANRHWNESHGCAANSFAGLFVRDMAIDSGHRNGILLRSLLGGRRLRESGCGKESQKN